MAESLFIRIDEPGGAAASLVLDAEARVVRGLVRGSLEDVARDAEGRRVVLLVPGPEAVAARAEMPAMSQARLRQSLPYSLEDQFAEDIDALHFAIGARRSDGGIDVVVTAHDRLARWLERLGAAGLVPNAVYADTEGVPDTPGSLTLVVDGPRLYARSPGGVPLALEGIELADAYDMLARGGEIRHVDVFADADQGPALRAAAEALESRGVDVDVRALGDGVVGRLASTLVFARGTNLLQGPYAPKSNVAARARPWYAAAGLAAGLIVLTIVSQGIELAALAREDRELSQWLASTCQMRYATTSLDRCGSEARRRLSEAGISADSSGESFLSALAVVADYHDTRSRIESLSYRNRVMSLQLMTDSVPTLDRLAQQIEQTRRFDVRIQAVNTRDEAVEGRLQLVEAAP